MDEYIGQDRIRENLLVSIQAARQRGEALDHVLLYGPPGLGKTTLAHVIGNELGVPVRSTAGPVLEKPGDLAAILTSLKAREVLFIDEIHGMSPAIEEILYPALEDYELDLVIGQGPGARSVKVPLQPFTLVGATTRTGLLTAPLRSRFGIVHRLDFYAQSDMAEIVRRSARILGVPFDDAAAIELSRRARGTPRIANRLLRRVRDYAQVRADGTITVAVARRGAGHARSRRARLRRDRSTPAADDHRQVRRRAGRAHHHRRRDQRGARRDRGHPRAVPDAARVHRSDAARPRRDRPAPTSTSGSPPRERTVVCGSRSSATRRVRDRLARDVRAAAPADQRRSRADGRDHRRVDPAAHRHPRAARRRRRRRHLGPGRRGRARGDRQGRPAARSRSS